MATDLPDLTATEALHRIRAGKLQPIALMEACLARIADREPVVRAFAWLDPDAARVAARAAQPGALHGLPLGVKDITGYRRHAEQVPGSPIWAGWRPKADAAAVAWAREAGAVVVGKTVTTELR